MKFSGIESKKGNVLARSCPRFIYRPAILAYSYAFGIFFAIAFITSFYNYLALSVPLHGKLLEGRDCIFIFYVAALLTLAPKWNQPRNPQTEQWRIKLWSVHTLEYLTIRRNESLTPAKSGWKHAKWRKSHTKGHHIIV